MSTDEVLTRPIGTLHVGLRESFTCRLTPDEIDRFAGLSGDRSPLHLDTAFAQSRGFSGRVAHGALLAALVSRLVGNRLPGALGILQSMDLEFRRPVVPPADLVCTGEITGISTGTGQITLQVKITNAMGELFALARVRSIVRD